MVTPDRVFEKTRLGLHTIAAHVLGRRRFEVSGHFGLRAGPAGIMTPAFGDGPETIRISGTVLIRETGGASHHRPIQGATLRELARFAGTDLDLPYDGGADGPPVGDADRALDLDPASAAEIADWFELGWRVLDETLAGLPDGAEAATIQLWPEHFDAATTVTLPGTDPVNLGFSPGDGFEAEPYLYVGPWGTQRPGSVEFWNAPFGATLARSQVIGSSDPAGPCRRFLEEGVGRMASAAGAR